MASPLVKIKAGGASQADGDSVNGGGEEMMP
jgi:hypothetical protein